MVLHCIGVSADSPLFHKRGFASYESWGLLGSTSGVDILRHSRQSLYLVSLPVSPYSINKGSLITKAGDCWVLTVGWSTFISAGILHSDVHGTRGKVFLLERCPYFRGENYNLFCTCTKKKCHAYGRFLHFRESTIGCHCRLCGAG